MLDSSRWIIPRRNNPNVVQNKKGKRGRGNWLQWLMKRGNNSNQEKTREEVNWEGSSWAVWVNQILMLTGRKTQLERRKLLIQQPQSTMKYAKMLHLSVINGKALKKSLNSLPSSPRKRRSVIVGLAKRAGHKLECQMKERARWNPSKETEGSVENFYFHPDISYTNYAR